MAAYIVATARISDPDRFAAYTMAIAGLSERFGGEVVVKGSVSELLEGNGADDERVVVSRYPDAQSARAYVSSREYKEAAALRVGSAEITMRLLVDPV